MHNFSSVIACSKNASCCFYTDSGGKEPETGGLPVGIVAVSVIVLAVVIAIVVLSACFLLW